jgi:hypothetical protein
MGHPSMPVSPLPIKTTNQSQKICGTARGSMREYIKRCREAYCAGGSELEYVQGVLSESEDPARQDLVRRGTKVLLELSKVQGRDKFISIHSVRLLSGIRKGQSKTAGLWPWLERNADVIEREEGQGAYRIKNEFYDAMVEVFREAQTHYSG